MIEIKHRFTGAVICSFDVATVKEAVIEAVKSGADLSGTDLYGANLSGANLYRANLYGANLSGEKLSISPFSISGLFWNVLISESYMRIGCQRHTHEEWSGFDNEAIADMHSNAVEFWNSNKQWLLAACASHKAQSLAYRANNPDKEAE